VSSTVSRVLRLTSVDTPVGTLLVAYQGNTVVASKLADDEAAFAAECADDLDAELERDGERTTGMSATLFARVHANASLSFDLEGRTPFQRAVLEYVAAIPRGEVRTYGEVARAVGHPGAARAVGEVMRKNRIAVLIPCHRVVRAGGDIGRYTPDPAVKRRLLLAEGALVP